jgi:hypothetical protein
MKGGLKETGVSLILVNFPAFRTPQEVQIYFCDVLLMGCLIRPGAHLSAAQTQQTLVVTDRGTAGFSYSGHNLAM